MNALLILIPITLVLAALAVGVFFWAVRHDQFEDLDSPGVMPLLDDESPQSVSRGPAVSDVDVPGAGARPNE